MVTGNQNIDSLDIWKTSMKYFSPIHILLDYRFTKQILLESENLREINLVQNVHRDLTEIGITTQDIQAKDTFR